MSRSLILGGTKGLGRSLALESVRLGYPAIVVGRSVAQATADPEFQACGQNVEFCQADLSDPISLPTVMTPAWADVRYVFWNAGIFMSKRLVDCGPDEISLMVATHLTGPIGALNAIYRLMASQRLLADPPGQPYHLVVVASTSSWMVRDHQAIYTALKAAKAHLARNYARELIADLPGSKVTLVNPGGIKTPNFWQGTGVGIENYMEPDDLAWTIWGLVEGQVEPFREYQIPRDPQGNPNVILGPCPPKSPF